MYSFFKYNDFKFSLEGTENTIVRFKNKDGVAKFQFKPFKLLSNKGVKEKDLNFAKEFIKDNEALLLNFIFQYTSGESKPIICMS